MVPVEWPIAAPPRDGGRRPARSADGRRLSSVRADFFLDSSDRLSEQERSLMTTMLADLVRALADEFTVQLGHYDSANDEDEGVSERLWSSGLLDIEELVFVLLQRAEEERIAAGLRSGAAPRKPRLLQSLVNDPDPEVAAAAMALILAKARRRDRFDGPRVAFDDLPAETAVTLANAVAAARRTDLAKRLDSAAVDERLTAAVRALLSSHDEGKRVEAKVFDLAQSLERTGRLDDAFIRSALEEAEVGLVAESLALKAGLSFDNAWACLAGGSGKLALLLRMGGISRDFAGECVGRLAEALATDAEAEFTAFDDLAEKNVESVRKWLRLDPSYRRAVGHLASGNGPPTI